MTGAAKKGTAKKAPAFVKRKDIKNPFISKGIRKLSNAKVTKLTGSWRFIKDPVALFKEAQKKAKDSPPAPKKPQVITKEITGEKNGGVRTILVKKPRKFYATEDSLKPAKRSRRRVYRAARASITPGTILILLAGRHRGRRVVFLKQLKSGLLLVTGPYKFNSCPLRRIHQSFVIATSKKVDISSLKFPDQLQDDLFAKPKKQRSKGNTAKGGDLFAQKKTEYQPSELAKKIQADVDKQLLTVIASDPEADIIKNYLKRPFRLNSNMYPHALKF